ncbi:bifunctional protein FolD, partial [Striga asiatica]
IVSRCKIAVHTERIVVAWPTLLLQYPSGLLKQPGRFIYSEELHTGQPHLVQNHPKESRTPLPITPQLLNRTRERSPRLLIPSHHIKHHPQTGLYSGNRGQLPWLILQKLHSFVQQLQGLLRLVEHLVDGRDLGEAGGDVLRQSPRDRLGIYPEGVLAFARLVVELGQPGKNRSNRGVVVTSGGLEDGKSLLIGEDGLVEACEGRVDVADAHVDGSDLGLVAVSNHGHAGEDEVLEGRLVIGFGLADEGHQTAVRGLLKGSRRAVHTMDLKGLFAQPLRLLELHCLDMGLR